MTPFTPEPLIEKPEEVEELPDPDPMETEYFRFLSRFNDLCVRNGFTAHLPAGTVLPQMCSIVESGALMRWFIKYPEAAHMLARKILRFVMRMARHTIEKYGPKNCSVSTELAWESNSVVSPKTFETFSLPYIVEMHAFYKSAGVRATMIHLCGDHKGNLRYWKDVPLPPRTIFSIGDSMDLRDTGAFLGEQYILGGNISTTILQGGSSEDVKQEVRRCLGQAMHRPGGFILMPACEFPPLAPAANLNAIREELMESGFY